MTSTTNLALPFIEAAQSQKHVTHNEALGRLDAIVMLAILDRDLSSPPASPTDGARYLVKATGTGAWARAGRQDRRLAGRCLELPQPESGLARLDRG